MAYESWKVIEGKNVPSTSGFSERILKYLRPKSKVLDLGCGYGRLSGFFASRKFEVYGIDINENAIKESKRNEELEGIKFSVQDATETNFDDNFFSGIISQAVLACMGIKDRRNMLNECFRILNQKGVIQISEFGQTENKEKYLEHKKFTGEYGTIVVKNPNGSEKFRSHNFSKKELKSLIIEAKLKVLHYENPKFITVNGKTHPGHIFLCQKYIP